ncbi:hypothetical protein [Mesorhizobium sp. M1B.F.Ca.ET.045.04.1.1]|uniref:hypothetical protein n=1 Tax=Mesorhizobium sp. M1B.F.Ca.ET.045.04.1.1 TaxID=2493673 RepID=UPI000F7528F6|nr:hypothetical protein [Mesorhizobium sp. M1B.F.Ca.ET.045.04.1.1]AZO29385.1 hypothetical protein EJ071_19660 [Mesorhizobium sp. M1B.F.Ca.ET.045.04.1.1]
MSEVKTHFGPDFNGVVRAIPEQGSSEPVRPTRDLADQSTIDFALWALRKHGYLECADKLNAALASSSPSGAAEPVAWRYRWKLDGEWTNWRVADHSQKAAGLRDLQEIPLYAGKSL